jgi:hypothetical protein
LAITSCDVAHAIHLPPERQIVLFFSCPFTNEDPFAASVECLPITDEFHINVLKWPHHAWRPTDANGIATMEAFLKAYHPEEIVICVPVDASINTKSKIDARVKDIRDIVDQAIKEEAVEGRMQKIRVRTTE